MSDGKIAPQYCDGLGLCMKKALTSAEIPVDEPVADHSPGFDTDEQARERFANDWNELISRINRFAKKYDMPAPDLIWHPRWFEHIQSTVVSPLLSTLIWGGVRSRFGFWEQRDTFRSL